MTLYTTRPTTASLLAYIRDHSVIAGRQWDTLAEDDFCLSALNAGFVRVKHGFYELTPTGLGYLEIEQRRVRHD